MTDHQPAKPVPKRKSRARSFYKEWLEPLLFALLVTQFIVTMVRVDGASMMPNLRNGERVIVPKYEYWLHRVGIGNYQRGDVVVFKPPQQAAEVVPSLNNSFLGLWHYRPFLIKRIIGVEGDRIRVQGGNVWINDKPLDGSFVSDYWQAQGCWDRDSMLANQATSSLQGVVPDQLEITVPANHYFVMGDNRHVNGSEDSRLFGSVGIANIAGRANMVVWPLSQPENLPYNCQANATATPSGKGKSAIRRLTPPTAFEQLRLELNER